MKKIIIAIVILTEIFMLKNWYVCTNLQDEYHFSSHDLEIGLGDAIHNDTGTPTWIIHLFHNKATFFTVDAYRHLTLYFDLLFLVNLIGPAGIFASAAGIYYFFESGKHKSFLITVLLMLVLMPLMEIYLKPRMLFPGKITIFALPYIILSSNGVSGFLSGRKKIFSLAVILLLVILSIGWGIIFSNDVHSVCI